MPKHVNRKTRIDILQKIAATLDSLDPSNPDRLGQIAEKLNAQGIVTPFLGKPWRGPNVSHFMRTSNAGFRKSSGAKKGFRYIESFKDTESVEEQPVPKKVKPKVVTGDLFDLGNTKTPKKFAPPPPPQHPQQKSAADVLAVVLESNLSLEEKNRIWSSLVRR